MSKFNKFAIFFAVVVVITLKMHYDASKEQALLGQNNQSFDLNQKSARVQSYHDHLSKTHANTVITGALNYKRENIIPLSTLDTANVSLSPQYVRDKKKQDQQKLMPIHSQLFYKDILRKWDNEVYQLHLTDLNHLAQPINNLQEIKDILIHKITTTDCEKILKKEMLKGFDMTIDAYLKYLIDDSEKPDIVEGEIADQFDKTKEQMSEC